MAKNEETGDFIFEEYKSSLSAPLTKNQKVGFPELNKYGGKIVGKGKEQYKEIYPDCLIENYLLKIAFEYDVSQKCIDFLSYVANQIKPLNIKIEAEVTR